MKIWVTVSEDAYLNFRTSHWITLGGASCQASGSRETLPFLASVRNGRLHSFVLLACTAPTTFLSLYGFTYQLEFQNKDIMAIWSYSNSKPLRSSNNNSNGSRHSARYSAIPESSAV
ncbi:hypothetical protein EJ08DRAFT_2562 [Tothia fuscella]|uniref:Uncharacterized protein n=1 Tax=Tothia fuscella TaxID=1048955 RepID=A0A9P4U5A0_9PEZI|nr:hypothetical protein EJ08DRAFT_2562 [Tothia fuscella]